MKVLELSTRFEKKKAIDMCALPDMIKKEYNSGPIHFRKLMSITSIYLILLVTLLI